MAILIAINCRVCKKDAEYFSLPGRDTNKFILEFYSVNLKPYEYHLEF